MLMIGDRPAPTAERPFQRNDVAEEAEVRHPGSMAQLVFLLTHGLRALLRDRADLALENLALRQQVAVLAERRPRPRLSTTDRLFWVFLRRLWSRWADVLVVVQPDTVVRWHRLGFRLFWRWRSRPGRPGRPRIDSELRDLIRQMARENPTWGAPRIHGELLMLGFDIAERTVSRYMPRRPAPGDVVERWKVFLRNHQEAIVGMDFFTVPTATFDILYVLVFVHHARRRVVHLAVTKWPTAAWVVQQRREAFPFDEAPRFLIFDRDAKFSTAVVAAIRSFGIQPSQTAYRSPWQNPIAERWIGSVRREMLDHVVVLGEAHLRRLLRQYVDYHHHDRCHLSLEKDAPEGRSPSTRPSGEAAIVALPRVGALHHRYEWRDAA